MMEYVVMNESHVTQIAQLEQLCFSAPWSVNSICGELSNPLALWLVALDGQRVVGYIGSQSVMGEADMMNLAVDSAYRRCGIGSQLVDRLIELLHNNQISSLTLEVRASNDAAKNLYKAKGFIQVGCRPNYYSNPKEDALILRKEWEV